jgi:hypoxanthine phosphoribosyltransferase
MSWEQYEVWATVEGQDELVDTTKSLKEARHLAKKAINEGATAATIYLETADGDYEEVDRLEA